MQTVFVTNADACGDHVFTQVARNGNVAVYRRNKVADGQCYGYETIVIKTTKAGTVYAKGATPTQHDTESYPGAASFGRLGFHFYNLKAALHKMDELLSKNDGGIDIPEGEFTFLDFAKVNGLPVNGSTATIIQSLIKKAEIVYLGKRMVGGKEMQVFTSKE